MYKYIYKERHQKTFPCSRAELEESQEQPNDLKEGKKKRKEYYEHLLKGFFYILAKHEKSLVMQKRRSEIITQ